MSDTASDRMNAALARLMGWTYHPMPVNKRSYWKHEDRGIRYHLRDLPNYTTSLDAMREVEAEIARRVDGSHYAFALKLQLDPSASITDRYKIGWLLLHASPEDRAKASLTLMMALEEFTDSEQAIARAGLGMMEQSTDRAESEAGG